MPIPYRVRELRIPAHPKPMIFWMLVTCLIAKGPSGNEKRVRVPMVIKQGIDIDARTLRPLLDHLEEQAVLLTKKQKLEPVRYLRPTNEDMLALETSMMQQILLTIQPKRGGKVILI